MLGSLFKWDGSKEVSKGTSKETSNGRSSDNGPVIELRQVVKTYETVAGAFPALKGIDLQVGAGEFAAVIGKSGSGKTTLINMITGIDRPTSGEVLVGGTAVHQLGEGQMARWRGLNVGVVYQFFQLLPSLSLFQNVMLPMDFCGMYSPRQRQERAMYLLEEMGIADHAHKRPAAISGGQQQRVAIARALANDPPIVAADEPTGNLDSRTAEAVFQLFEKLVAQGKTFVMVTHDRDLARRVTRTVILADGEIIEEHLARIFPALSEEELIWATSKLETQKYSPGSIIIREGARHGAFYIITRGGVEVILRASRGQEFVVASLGVGQYFGEIELLRGGESIATIRAARDVGVEVAALDREAFIKLLAESEPTRAEIERIVQERIRENIAGRKK